MKRLIAFTLVLSFSGLGPLRAQDDIYTEKLKRFFEITKSGLGYDIVLEGFGRDYNERYGQSFSEEYFRDFKENLFAESFDNLMRNLTPLYQTRLTEEDLDKIIAFYESDTGQSYLNMSAPIQDDLIKIVSEWMGNLLPTTNAERNEYLRGEFAKNYDVKCKNLRTGEFYSLLPDGNQVNVTRTEKKQIETFEGKTYDLEVKWLDDCSYYLIDYVNDFEGRFDTLHIKITATEKQLYRYIAKDLSKDIFKTGEIYFAK